MNFEQEPFPGTPETNGIPPEQQEAGVETSPEPAALPTLTGSLALNKTVEVESVSPAPNSQKSTRKNQKRDGRKSKEQLANPKPKGGRGHFRQHLKTQLNQSGKLNAQQPMSPEQKKLRRRKRK